MAKSVLLTFFSPAFKEKQAQEEAAKMDPAMLEHISFFESDDNDSGQSAAPQPKRVFNSFGWVSASQVRQSITPIQR